MVTCIWKSPVTMYYMALLSVPMDFMVAVVFALRVFLCTHCGFMLLTLYSQFLKDVHISIVEMQWLSALIINCPPKVTAARCATSWSSLSSYGVAMISLWWPNCAPTGWWLMYLFCACLKSVPSLGFAQCIFWRCYCVAAVICVITLEVPSHSAIFFYIMRMPF